MSNWSWKQAVAERILHIVNTHKSLDFSLSDVLQATSSFRKRFPRNQHVREKTRQTLQRLRDDGLIEFVNRGHYRLVVNNERFDFENANLGERGVEIPGTKTIVRRLRLRDTLLACEMKRRYENVCQLCRESIMLANSSYSESHHIKPIGSPHFGPDVQENILVLCPNHHIMFDRGACHIDAQSFTVDHLQHAFKPRPLLLHAWHRLSEKCINYYNQHIVAHRSL